MSSSDCFCCISTFELDLLAISQLPSDTDVETLANVHVDELPLYENVSFTVTDHKVLPDEFL